VPLRMYTASNQGRVISGRRFQMTNRLVSQTLFRSNWGTRQQGRPDDAYRAVEHAAARIWHGAQSIARWGRDTDTIATAVTVGSLFGGFASDAGLVGIVVEARNLMLGAR
jgi:hypothetical protein